MCFDIHVESWERETWQVYKEHEGHILSQNKNGELGIADTCHTWAAFKAVT